MKKEEVLDNLTNACNQLYNNRHDLIVTKSHERTITAELKSYLEPLFSAWDVNVEYNREGADGDHKEDLDGNRIVPDIVIHTRGHREGPNLTVIQVKGFWNREDRAKDELDLKKLRAKFGYEYLYRLELNADGFKLIEVK